ncbi:MAG: GWxTD domain-containing protein [Flavobacteriales bacterium]
MMRTSSIVAFALVVMAAVPMGCGTAAPSLKRDNMVGLYGKGSVQLRLQARVHHTGPEHTTVYYKLNTRDLLYKSDGSGGPFRCAVRLAYESYADWNSKVLLDSASTLIQDKSTETDEDRELIGSMDLRRNEHRTFVIKVTARDLNRDVTSSVVVLVQRDDAGSGQYFLPSDTTHGLPLFDDHLLPGQAIAVRCEAFAGHVLYGSHHPVTSALPVPVFAPVETKRNDPGPDSTFIITVDADGRFRFGPVSPGIYHLRPDTASDKGFTLFVLTESYPYVGSGVDMLKPLRYITSMQEYDKLSKATNVRQAIERFWLDAAGDRERAREAIRIYYTRVENANRHFSSLVEGWRTDRGLVHIIFGSPTTIYKNETSESWIYGEENNLMSLTFTFVKRASALSDNDLVLEHDPAMKGAWYRNVESWRNGRVYQN